MKKKMGLAIVTLKAEAGKIYSKQIKDFFDGSVEISTYSFEEENIVNIKEKLIVLSTFLKFDVVKQNTSEDSQIMVPRITLKKSSIDKLKDIESGKDVLLFNLTPDMAIETISLIYQLGINHINLIPCYPQMEEFPDCDLVITPGEAELITGKFKTIIDIGYRVLDLGTILDIAAQLNLSHMIKPGIVDSYFQDTITNNLGLEKIMGEASDLENQFNILMKVIDDCMICTNNMGIIYFHSKKASNLLNANQEVLTGARISEYINDIDFNLIYSQKNSKSEHLIKINDVDMIIEISYLKSNKFEGFIHKLKQFSAIEAKQAKLRAKLLDNGNKSKYTFNNIKGISESIKKTVEIAKQMALSEASVLIIGETGTGKELFAQAIHNNSSRREGPFVAVNCGVFHENLFQSELFGYDEGAFTGAKKGGKQGLFELAHKGTIFLDEIGEMDLALQSKLLRVIQEKQIRRIGSDRVIDIDIRIIAATNRDLAQLAKEKLFRKDLYYRLNVLPLNIRPLRERKEDIGILIDDLKSEIKSEMNFTEGAMKMMMRHPWEGNVRELRNAIEYCHHLSKEEICWKDLPWYIINEAKILEDEGDCEVKYKDEEVEILILDCLLESHFKKTKLGRKTLSKKLEEKEIYITEQEMRNILKDMEEKNIVKISKGRGGTEITSHGIEYLKLKNLKTKLD